MLLYRKSLFEIIVKSGIVLWLFPLICIGQNFNNNVKLYTANEGLPQNNILGLAQDSSGFIWVGTKDGLARYDGYNFKVYRHGKDSLHTPAGNDITNLHVDYLGYLWIQYSNRSIDRYDPKKNIFDHLTGQPAFDSARKMSSCYWLTTDHRGNLWLWADSGFYCYNYETKILEHFTTKRGLLSDSNKGLIEDRFGKIWMITDKGFSVYDPLNHKITNILHNFNAKPTYHGRDYKFGAGTTIDGKIIVTDLEGGYGKVIIYDPQNGAFRSLALKSSPLLNTSYSGNTNLLTVPNGNIWFICNGILYTMDNKCEAVKEYSALPDATFNDLTSLLVDRSGTLWFGRSARGLYKVNLDSPPFISKNYVHNLDTDILTRELNMHINELHPNSFYQWLSYYCRKATDKKNGLIWMQNWFLKDNSTLFYDIRTKKITSIKPLFKNADIGIDTDSAGHAWMFVNTVEICKMSYKQGKIHQQLIEVPQLKDLFLAQKEVPVNLVVHGRFMWIMANALGDLDFSLWKLYALNLDSKEVSLNRLRPDNIESYGNLLMMIKDPINPNYLWIATTAAGLLRFDKSTGTCHAFTTDDGLPNNTVYAIVPDDAGNFWLSTNKGLCRFNAVTHTVRSFDVTDGLIDNEFNRWHYFKLPDGRIAFGGMTGYTIFDPAAIKDDAYQPRILVSDLLVNNKALPDNSSTTAGHLNALDKLVLPYDQNFLTFEFASDEYTRPDKIFYRYKLNNFDNDWVYLKNTRMATYTKLPPGKYTLEANATNTSGIWSRNIRKLQVVILPPWWQTWWAYAIYGTIASSLIFSFFYYRLKQVRMQHAVILKQKEAEQLRAVDEMKSRFFANITHELRTPLSLIISPVEKLQKQISELPIQKTLANVQRNAEHLLALINQLLDLSKLESGTMKVSWSQGKINEFIQHIIDAFSPLAEYKEIELNAKCAFSEELLFDADKLKTIISNLLSNALKFTPARGTVTLKAWQENAQLHIIISDTGVGIAEEHLPYIFNRFYQADNSHTRAYEGTGIGLALVKELIGLMGGSVIAKSKQNNGTIFTISLPVLKLGDAQAPLWQDLVNNNVVPFFKINAKEDEVQLTERTKALLLLVEDNEELCAFLKESLEGNYRVLTARNGIKGLSLAKEELPEIIISDVMMPEMDGYELCRQVKNDTITNHIAVILLTAKIAHQSRMHGLTLGADDYINKPFHIDELESRIHNLLDHQAKLRSYYLKQFQNKDSHSSLNEVENAFLQKIYTIIDEHIDDTELDVPKLSAKMLVSQRTLNRKLNVLLGISANELVRKYRLKKGLSLLQQGKNVTETAYMVGFETPAYFSQCFKEEYGVPPREYASLS